MQKVLRSSGRAVVCLTAQFYIVLQSVSLQQLSDVKFHHFDDFGRAPGQSFDQFRTYQDQAPNPARTGDSISLKLKSGWPNGFWKSFWKALAKLSSGSE